MKNVKKKKGFFVAHAKMQNLIKLSVDYFAFFLHCIVDFVVSTSETHKKKRAHEKELRGTEDS